MKSVIDAHLHLWDPGHARIPWIEGSPLERPMLPSHVDGGGAERWIFVETDARSSPLDEVTWVESLRWAGLVGIVADIDLGAEGLRDDLAVLGAHPLVRGGRHLLQDLPAGALRESGFGRGLRAVADAGMVFDACVTWSQLNELTVLLRTGGGGSVVLDHLGKPPIDAGIDSEPGRAWLAALRSLADLDGVSVKLSGLRAEAPHVRSLRVHAPGFLAAALEVFGPDRCMLGSDWPVSTGAVAGFSTAEWFEMVRGVAGAEWARVAAGTAERVYRLG